MAEIADEELVLLQMILVLYEINVPHDLSVALSVIHVRKYVDLAPSEPEMIDAGTRRISDEIVPSINGDEITPHLHIPPISHTIGAIHQIILSGQIQEVSTILVHHYHMFHQAENGKLLSMQKLQQVSQIS